MTTDRPTYWWEDFSPEAARSGADLAVLRRGIGAQPGTVPQMWRFHRTRISDFEADTGAPSARLTAEHTALTLFAVHQQSQQRPMHIDTIGLGTALRLLRQSEKYKNNPDALNARVNALATSSDVPELSYHLRGLITLLRSIGQPLDYTRLCSDVYSWHFDDGPDRVRRRWGAQYYDWAGEKPKQNTEA